MNGSRVLASACAVLLVLLVACLLSGPSQGAECRPLNVARVIDGDSLISDRGERIRLQGIDTAEIRATCAREEVLAHLAKDNLTLRIRSAENVSYCPSGLDRYGRTLATILVDGEDVGQALVVDGLARVWTGKREEWCGE